MTKSQTGREFAVVSTRAEMGMNLGDFPTIWETSAAQPRYRPSVE